MRTSEEQQNDYIKYRGKCKQLAEDLVAVDPTLKLVRGHYYCFSFGKQAHWWCEKPDGTIVDPSAKQFPSNGHGLYEPFNGICECAECGKEIKEEEADIDGRYAFCSTRCHMRFVGL